MLGSTSGLADFQPTPSLVRSTNGKNVLVACGADVRRAKFDESLCKALGPKKLDLDVARIVHEHNRAQISFAQPVLRNVSLEDDAL